MSDRCAVIGSGIAGMAVAIRLAAQGYRVEVFERSDRPGGKVNEIRLGDFRFDFGPTVLTLPWLIDELFILHGKNPRDYFNYTKLEHISNFFFPDGKLIRAYGDPEKYASELKEKLGLPEERFQKYLSDAAEKFDLTEEVFLRSSLHQLKNYTRWKAIRGILLFHRVGTFISMARKNSKILRNKIAERIVNRYAQYNGSDPYKASSTFNVIGHVEITKGVFQAAGGMQAVIGALKKLCDEVGVVFHFNSDVKKIIVEKGRVEGLSMDSGVQRFNFVVSNADIHHTMSSLLGRKIKLPKPAEMSSSAILFCWAVKGNYPLFSSHNYVLGADCRQEFQSIFDRIAMPDDGAIYIHISSRIEPKDSPEGHENWFIMLNAPVDNGQDWEAEVDKLRVSTIKRISTVIGTDIGKCILDEKTVTPKILGSLYLNTGGAIYGRNSNSIWSAFLRHANFSSEVGGLYFTGGSVHPGAGIPLCLHSAAITSRLIEEREKK